MEKKARAELWCRDCGNSMKQWPYGQLTFSCKKCRLTVDVHYKKSGIMRAQ